MRIGEVAALAGVNVQTIRFYERRGLLGRAERLASGYRHYRPDTARLVRFIKQAQGLGFTLDEIKHLVMLREPRPDTAARIRALANSKIQSIEDKIGRLQQMRDELSSLLKACECGADHPTCDISGC